MQNLRHLEENTKKEETIKGSFSFLNFSEASRVED